MNEWIGGFVESNPEFSYPEHDLSSLPILDNMANIGKLQRQMKVKWPEFSWTPIVNNKKKRYYQRFANDISRIGYTSRGRVYSIICPQQGTFIKNILNLNVEITVTGQRGWVNEKPADKNYMAANLGVMGRVWFSPDGNHCLIKKIFEKLNHKGLPFDKCNAIDVMTSSIGDPENFMFDLTQGESKHCEFPPFTKHDDKAFTVGHIDVQINEIIKTGDSVVDNFNQMVLDIFNILSHNMLANKNILTWNVWFTSPEIVDQKEWAEHAEKWRKSLNVDHKYPDGDPSEVRDFKGKVVNHTFIDRLKIIQVVISYIFKNKVTLVNSIVNESDDLNDFIKEILGKDIKKFHNEKINLQGVDDQIVFDEHDNEIEILLNTEIPNTNLSLFEYIESIN